MEHYTDPNRYEGTDSARLQAAVDDAAKRGLGMTVISRKEDDPLSPWELTETLLLPSDFTLVIDNCTLRLADGVFCNAIANRNYTTPLGRTAAGRQRNIRVEGRGSAVISGGEYNGLGERNANRDGRPPIWVNAMLLFTNVEGIALENLRLERSRWWAVCFIHCACGEVRHLRFASDCTYVDENGAVIEGIPDNSLYERIRVKNSDGVDLRCGCHDFLLEDLSGFTEDDTVALTGLPARPGRLEETFYLEGASTDIRNVIIRDIHSYSFCSLVRLLNQGGIQLYNVTISGVTDTWEPDCGVCRSGYTVRLGDAWPYGGRAALPEETRNITVENVTSAAEKVGVNLSGGMSGILVRNARLSRAGENAKAVSSEEADGWDITTE